jgi:hypothetical protein
MNIIKPFYFLALVTLFVAIATGVRAADKITLTVNNQKISAYRTVDLESAKKDAAAAHKPIAWISGNIEALDGTTTIEKSGSPGATLHALFALRSGTVLVFMDGIAENHKVIPFIDAALHTPNPHYTIPTVLFLDPEAKEVLARTLYEPDFEKRAYALAGALKAATDKLKAAAKPPAKAP